MKYHELFHDFNELHDDLGDDVQESDVLLVHGEAVPDTASEDVLAKIEAAYERELDPYEVEKVIDAQLEDWEGLKLRKTMADWEKFQKQERLKEL